MAEKGFFESLRESAAKSARDKFTRPAADFESKKFEKVNIDDRITTTTTRAEVEAMADLGEQENRLAIVDISDIVNRYAKTLADKKVNEHLQQKARWWNRWFVRQTEAGYFEKYYAEAKQEIIKNRNLLSDIQIRWLKKSRGKALERGDDETHFELLDEIIESLLNERLQREGSKETQEDHVRDIDMDARAAELMADYVTGSVTSRAEFEKRAEEQIFRPLMKNRNQKEGSMYASNLFAMAENYKRHFEEKLEAVGKEFGPEQKELIRTYLRKTMRLDVMLAKKQADIAREQPKGALRWLEKTVNFTQNPLLKEPPKTWWGRTFHKIAGLTLGNPVLYAFLGNRLAYGGAVATGAFAAKTLGIGTAAALGIGPGMALAAGAGIGAGIYLGMRAAVERFKDIRRRKEEALLGQREAEMHELFRGRQLIEELSQLAAKSSLDDQDKAKAAGIMAILNIQDTTGYNLISVGEKEERYGSNFLAVQDLRRAILEFWEKKRQEFGQTEQRQRAVLDAEIVAAKNLLLQELAVKDKEAAKEIRRRGLAVGAIGTLTTMTAACLAPGAYKLLKMGVNRVWEFFGGSHRLFDTSKVTFTEEIWHKIAEKFGREHYPHYQGDFVNLPMAGSDRHQFIEFPKNQDVQICLVKPPAGQGNGYLEISNLSHAGPKVQIPLDSHGNIVDESVFTQLKQYGWDVEKIAQSLPPSGGSAATAVSAAGASRRDVTAWLSDLKQSHHPGVSMEEVHTKGFYDNWRVDSEGNLITPHVHNANELRLHISRLANGDAKFDCNNLLKSGSWRVVGDNVEQPDMLALRSSGKLKFAFIPDAAHPHEAVLLDMDNAGNAIIPKGSRAYDLLDPATGVPRQGVVYGTARVETGASGQDLYWVNSERGHGALMDYGQAAAGSQTGLVTGGGQVMAEQQIFGWRLRPQVFHGVEDFWLTPTGWRRQKDKDLDELRKSQQEKGSQTGEHPSTTETGAAAPGDANAEHATSHVTTGGGGGGGGAGGGGPVPETAPSGSIARSVINETTSVGSPKATARRVRTSVKGVESGVASAKRKSKESKLEADPTLENVIRTFNSRADNISPHIKLDFEESLTVQPKAGRTLEKVRFFIQQWETNPQAKIRDERFKNMNVKLVFTNAGSYKPYHDANGTLVLEFRPEVEIISLFPIIRRQLGKFLDARGVKSPRPEETRRKAA
jgi:hypothetical protein